MKFLIDAHLPNGVADLLEKSGHDVLRTQDLPGQNRTSDAEINTISINQERIVVSKDKDFYYSHILGGAPWKLVIIRTGNLRRKELTLLFETHLDDIIEALEHATLVELYEHRIRISN